MLRRGIEDKAGTQTDREDVFVGTDGGLITRERLEDPGIKGRTRPGRLFTWDEIRAAAHYDLVSPGGQPFRCLLPVPLTPDPAVISGSETPPELRAELDAAEEARSAWMRRRGELFEAGRRATERWQLAARKQDAKAYDRALADELQVAEQLRDIAAEEPLLVRRIARANDAIRRWQYLERLRRTEAAAGR